MKKQGLSERFILYVIRVARRVFYNTPIQRIRAVTVIYEWLFHLAISPDELVDVTCHGLHLQLPGRDVTILPSLMNNTYEVLELELMEFLLKPGMTVIDVGANVGIHTSIAARSVAPSGTVYGFEPVPENFEILVGNLARNQLTNVTLEALAVGNEVGHSTMYLEEHSIGTHSLLRGAHSTPARSVSVSVTTLDGYFIDHMPDVVDLLKIDVEGYEPNVLQGASTVLERTEHLLIEYSRASIEVNGGVASFIELLAGFDHLYAINERSQTLTVFSRSDFYETHYVNLFASKREVSGSLFSHVR
ncbi:MAG: FkbM family methyltransferase [Acidimicrobiales bacterium]